MHAAEHDVGGLGPRLSQLGQLEAVASRIDPANDLVTLIVVPQDEQPVAKRGLGGGDPLVQFLERGICVGGSQPALESHHCGGLSAGDGGSIPPLQHTA